MLGGFSVGLCLWHLNAGFALPPPSNCFSPQNLISLKNTLSCLFSPYPFMLHLSFLKHKTKNILFPEGILVPVCKIIPLLTYNFISVLAQMTHQRTVLCLEWQGHRESSQEKQEVGVKGKGHRKGNRVQAIRELGGNARCPTSQQSLTCSCCLQKLAIFCVHELKFLRIMPLHILFCYCLQISKCCLSELLLSPPLQQLIIFSLYRFLH